MWPLCPLSYRTHRTAWSRVPSIREGAPGSTEAPPGAHPRPLPGTRTDISDIQSKKKKRIKRTRMDYAWGYIQVPTGGLEVWLFPLLLGIFNSLSCSRTLRQDTQLLMDNMGFMGPSSTSMPMPELAMVNMLRDSNTTWACWTSEGYSMCIRKNTNCVDVHDL